MKPRIALSTALLALASLPGFAAPAAYVSAEGNDSRNRSGCALAQPCRTFQVAHDVVDIAGQVVALDTADYGTLNVTKSVSIVGSPGAVASISVAAGNGVTIATAGVDVVLRNLHITGAGGSRGIDVSAARSVTIENSVVAGFAADGVRLAPVGTLSARILNTVVRGNGGNGLLFLGRNLADVAHSQFTGNGGSGLYVLAAPSRGADVAVSDSGASGNGQHGFASSTSSGAVNRVTLVRSSAANNTGSGFHNEALGDSISRMAVTGAVASGNNIGFFNLATMLIMNSRFVVSGHNLAFNNNTDGVGPGVEGLPF